MLQVILSTLSSGNVAVPASITYETFVSDIADLSTYTYNSVDIGTADDNRYVVVGVTVDGGFDVKSVHIAGIAASQVVLSETNNNNRVALYMAHVPTGTTATINVNFVTTAARSIVTVWSVTPLITPIIVDTATSTASPAALSLDVVPGSVGMGITYNESETESHTWVGLTENVETGNIDGVESSAASNNFTTTETVTITDTYSGSTDVVGCSASVVSSSNAQIFFVGYETSITTSITVPDGIQTGDLMVFKNKALNLTGSPPTAVAPSEFTLISSVSVDGGLSSDNVRQTVYYKISQGDEGGTSLTGMNGTLSEHIELLIFRISNKVLTSVTVSTPNEQGTSGNPTLQTVVASGGVAPLIVFGCYGSGITSIAPRTFSPAEDKEISADMSTSWIVYKIYNSSPQDTDVDMDDEDTNCLQSFYIQFN